MSSTGLYYVGQGFRFLSCKLIKVEKKRTSLNPSLRTTTSSRCQIYTLHTLNNLSNLCIGSTCIDWQHDQNHRIHRFINYQIYANSR